jgi:regulator of sigma E protease
MNAILHLAQTLASFALVLGVLVSIHELGHYAAARWAGVRVEAFSIGFGPAIRAWTDRRGTVWKICVLPLGGYVKMYGMSPEARAEAEAAGEVFAEQDAYVCKPVGHRAIIAAAGPVANFLLAIVLFAALLGSVGRQVPLPVVGEVVPGTAAAAAGLRTGDVISAVDGAKVVTFADLRRIVGASPDRDLKLSVHRGTADLTVPVHVQAGGSAAHPVGKLGVTSGATSTEHVGPVGALVGGVTQTWDMVVQTVAGLATIISTGQGAEDLGGPIMIAHLSGQVAQLGLASLVTFIALLSVNLGLVNLLPIPVLDGGHLMFYAAEALRGRPVPPRAQEYGYRVGIALIACVFVFVSWNDLVHEGALKWVAHLAG